MENHIKRLSQYQQSVGHSVVVAYNQGEAVGKNDVQVLSKFKLIQVTPQVLRDILYNSSVLVWLLLSRQKFDVVHIHGSWSSLIGARLIKTISGARHVVFSIHDRLKEDFRQCSLLPFMIKFVGIKLVCSTGMQPIELLANRVDDCQFLFQPSGVDDLFFKQLEWSGSSEIITVANLVPKKNFDLILDIACQMPYEKFVIIGDGPEKDRLIGRVIGEKIENVRFLGQLSKQQIVDRMASAWAFLITSYAEGTPTAALEALACGVPVVSSASGGIEYLIEAGRHGFIVQNMDCNEYVLALTRLKELSMEGVVKKRDCRFLAEKFVWDVIGPKITKEMCGLDA